MPRRSRAEQRDAQAEQKAAQAELDRARRILAARIQRIQRIQTLHYHKFLARHPASRLPVPPLVVGSRSEWERAYQTWRDAVLIALQQESD